MAARVLLWVRAARRCDHRRDEHAGEGLIPRSVGRDGRCAVRRPRAAAGARRGAVGSQAARGEGYLIARATTR
jgi:hypothetical protein